MYLKKISREENLQVPKWQLYSNPIVTGTISGVAFLMIILMGVFYDFHYEDGNTVSCKFNDRLLVRTSCQLFFHLFMHSLSAYSLLFIKTPK